MGALAGHHAALDAMVLQEKRVVSYRTLSSELSMSTTEAQACLLEYCNARAEKLHATWAVTLESDSVRRTSLVIGEQPLVKDNILRVAVWAIAASSSADSTKAKDSWIQADRSRELQIVKRKAAAANELRDNNWNRIKSNSSGWNAGGAAAQQRAQMEALSNERSAALKKKQSSGIVAKVKAEVAARDADRRKRAGAVKNSSIQFSRSTSKSSAKEQRTRPNTTEGEKPQSSSFRMLGDSLVNKQRPTSAPSKGKSKSVKKTRRIIQISDDEDDSSDEDGDVEMKQEREAMEAEAEELELAEKEREAAYEEVEHPVKSPPTSAKPPKASRSSQKKAVREPTHTKRSRNDEDDSTDRPVFGSRNRKRGFAESAAEDVIPLRKKYKAVEQDVTEFVNGYVTTRRVTKYVDEYGNERPADEVPKEDKNIPNSGNQTPTTQSGTEYSKKKESTVNSAKSGKGESKGGKGHGSGDAADDQKKISSKRGAAGKAKNKNASIMSYFGKKS